MTSVSRGLTVMTLSVMSMMDLEVGPGCISCQHLAIPYHSIDDNEDDLNNGLYVFHSDYRLTSNSLLCVLFYVLNDIL